MKVVSAIGNRFVYYVFAYPVSLMPLWSHRGLAALIYFVLYRIIGYRRSVVRQNLRNSFPQWTSEQLSTNENRFYRFLSKLFIESIKNISISKEKLLERVRVVNPEVLEQLYDQGKSVLLAGGHYHNWEYVITAQNLIFSHQAVGIGSKMSSSFWNEKMTEKRERYGMRVIHKDNLHEKLTDWKDENIAILALFDQSPPHADRAYWTTFLSQPTGFLFGTEKLAYTYDFAVVQYQMREIRSGFYEIELELVTDTPRTEEYGVITEKLINNLEQQILRVPQFWLWSHKRWKLRVPEDFEALRNRQKSKYLQWRETQR